METGICEQASVVLPMEFSKVLKYLLTLRHSLSLAMCQTALIKEQNYGSERV
jgi:hypothetical protein